MGFKGAAQRTGQPTERIWPAFTTVVAFATLPYVELAGGNLGEIDLPRLMLWWGTTAGVAALTILLAGLAGGARRSAVFTGVGLYLFFRAPSVHALHAVMGFGDGAPALGWLIITLLAMTALVPLSRRRVVQLFLVLVSAGLVVAAALPLLGLRTGNIMSAPGEGNMGDVQPVTTPNIWVFVPDGYSRADVIEARTGMNMTPWLDELRERGFAVPARGRANYPATWSSLSAMLEMEYVLDEHDRIANRRPLYDRVRGNNATVQTLRTWGYFYVHSGGVAWEGSRCGGYEDLCVGQGRTMTETEWALLRMTPLSSLLERSLFQDVANLSDPTSVVDAVLENEPTSPYFVFAHLLSPHPPFVRDENCAVREDVPNYVQGQPSEYVDMVTCLNQQFLSAVDAILRTDGDAVIVIQSDHGHDWGLNWKDPHDPVWEGPAGRDRWPLVAAIRQPDTCPPPPDTLSPVNTMRLILTCLSGQRPELAPYRSWITTYAPEVVPNPLPPGHH